MYEMPEQFNYMLKQKQKQNFCFDVYQFEWMELYGWET